MKRLKIYGFFLVFLLTAFSITISTSYAESISQSGLPLPRFVSLRFQRVNLRSGPGTRYPVKWVYLKIGLPVEVITEFDNWRLVRDWEGTEGWMHQSTLSGRRMIRITGVERNLRNSPAEDSPLVAKLEAGVIGKLLQCPRDSMFCRVEVNNYHGWLKRGEFWGVYPGEHID
ncbi:MAG: SH3 domain-containing protein [Alphaproteobacteria bacterium]